MPLSVFLCSLSLSLRLEFAAHYRFEPCPAEVQRGNEKGRVERVIRYMRPSLWPARTWTDLDDLNEQAERWCLQDAGRRTCSEDSSLTVRKAWEQEKDKLLTLPAAPSPVHERVQVKAGKTPYVRFEGNHYSLPHTHVRRSLTLSLCDERHSTWMYLRPHLLAA